MKIGFYAITVGPATMLKLIAEAAGKLGHQVVVGEKLKPVPVEQISAFVSCDALLVGTSSLNIEAEIELIKAMPPKIPIVVVEDIPGSSLRPQVKNLTSRIAAVIVGMAQWIEKARHFGYRQVVYCGPPAHWKASYDSMIGDVSRRSEFRIKRGRMLTPLDYDDVLFSYGGIKEHRLNNRIIKTIIETGKKILGDRFVFCFKNHPGEPKNEVAAAERESLLDECATVSPVGLTLPELVRSADVPIFTSGATDSIVAAYARLPALYYTDADTREYMAGIGCPDGRWFVADLGGVMTIDGAENAESAVKLFLSEEGKRELRMSQEENFPLPETWDPVPRILDFVETLL